MSVASAHDTYHVIQRFAQTKQLSAYRALSALMQHYSKKQVAMSIPGYVSLYGLQQPQKAWQLCERLALGSKSFAKTAQSNIQQDAQQSMQLARQYLAMIAGTEAESTQQNKTIIQQLKQFAGVGTNGK